MSIARHTWTDNHRIYQVPIHETYECQLPAHESYGSATRYSGKLGRWLQVQRMAKRGSQHVTSISAERLALLQVLVDEGKLWWDALMQVYNGTMNCIT